ncbi:hypothetical protein EUX98_g8861 [Antrodiella citrinella]|uniref:Reverse transcriptase domain-containing protein n=1 Tax=Antrodiella citrinella TaxID=2447956 RepID=A0A4S4M262_9APHY|nr:hypothetical protein EUX98_g8861 [Antrodiella citrinella]
MDQSSAKTYDNYAIKKYGAELVNSNRWSVLPVEEMEDDNDLDIATRRFTTLTNKLSTEYGIEKTKSGASIKMPGSVARALKKRNALAQKITQLNLAGSEISHTLQKQFSYAQRRYNKVSTQWLQKNEMREIRDTMSDANACDLKKVWARLKAKVRHDNDADPLPTIKDKRGKLCVHKNDILNAIAEHYDDLANADSAESQDAAHWQNVDIITPVAEDMPGMNNDFSWPETLVAIRRMKINTTPGIDGVHVNLLKAMLSQECELQCSLNNPRAHTLEYIRHDLPADELPHSPLTNMGKALFPLLQKSWRSSHVPEQWNKVQVCNLFKSGDPEDMNNYRGISLISVVQKIILSVMAERLQAQCEASCFFVQEQAGFRRGEEAVAQYIAMAEIIRRRSIKGLPTYAVFVDFKKAFDKVSHEALYRILDHMGVRGRFLEYVKSVYRGSIMSVRAGGYTTREFGMKRGTRQGCPLSPILFIIFINFLFKETAHAGVKVPGLAARCPGGKYADDVLALAATSEQAKIFCDRIHAWGVKWGMALGIKKCGVMLIDEENSDEWQIHYNTTTHYATPDGDIPKVYDYKYLGITIDTTIGGEIPGLNELTFVKSQAAKGEKIMAVLRPFLRDPKWPISLKANLIRTLLMSKMLYGSEWVGYKEKNSHPIQTVMTKALRYALGVPIKAKAFDPFTICYELGLPTAQQEQTALRARLSAKLEHSKRLKTWIKTLYDKPLTSKKRSWVSATKTWETTLFHARDHDFPNGPREGFGQIDERPTNFDDYAYVYCAQFLDKVAPIYLARLFPPECPYFGEDDEEQI